jgi:hypothetical protein
MERVHLNLMLIAASGLRRTGEIRLRVYREGECNSLKMIGHQVVSDKVPVMAFGSGKISPTQIPDEVEQ